MPIRFVLQKEPGRKGWVWRLYYFSEEMGETVNPALKTWQRRPSDRAVYDCAYDFLRNIAILQIAGDITPFLRDPESWQLREVDIDMGGRWLGVDLSGLPI